MELLLPLPPAPMAETRAAEVLPSAVTLWQRPAVWVFALGLAARLLVLALFSQSPHFGVQGGDMRFYHEWALRILHGEWTDHHAFYGLPGYAFFLAGIYSIFGVYPAVVLVLQAVVDAGTALLIFQMTRLVLGRTNHAARWAGAASVGWILFVPAQAFSAVLMPTVLAAGCFWFCVWQAMRTDARERLWRWLGLGALVGAMAMAVATVLFALPLLVFSAATRARRGLAIALLLVGVALGSSPAWLHNRIMAHDPVFLSAHGGINFWIGNAPGANGYPQIPAGLRSGQQELLADSVAIAEQASGHELTRGEVSRFWSRKAWGTIREHPGRWAALLAVKVRNFWNAFSYDDVTIIPLLREEGVLLPGVGFGFVAVLGLAGLLPVAVENRRGRWVVAAVLLHMMALLPVFITERYRLAAAPGLLVLGACGLARAWEHLQARRPLEIGGCAALCCASVALVCLPVPPSLLTSMEPYNLAISELDAGQLDRAERHLAEAEKLAPRNAALLFAQGNLWLKHGDSQRAKGFYRQSLEQDPRNAAAYTNLGLIAYGEKRWDFAARFFKAALALEPRDAETRQLLQQVEAKSPPH